MRLTQQASSFVAKLPIDADDSIICHKFVNQSAWNNKFFINFGIPAPRNPDTFTAAGFKDPKPALPGSGKPGKSGGHIGWQSFAGRERNGETFGAP